MMRGVHSLFPPNNTTLRTYCESRWASRRSPAPSSDQKGFSNAMQWLIDNDLIERDEGSAV